MTAPKVDSYRFGHLVVDGATFKEDFMVRIPKYREPTRYHAQYRLAKNGNGQPSVMQA